MNCNNNFLGSDIKLFTRFQFYIIVPIGHTQNHLITENGSLKENGLPEIDLKPVALRQLSGVLLLVFKRRQAILLYNHLPTQMSIQTLHMQVQKVKIIGSCKN
jgi:hypothetical protein